MSVEIRELVIKTTIASPEKTTASKIDNDSIAKMKQQILQECLRSISRQTHNDSFDR